MRPVPRPPGRRAARSSAASLAASGLLLLLAAASPAHAGGLCTPGHRVLAEPGDHPATVLAASGASCRLHYEDGAFPDGWDYDFNLKATGADAANRAAASRGPRAGRYDITVGTGFYDGYLMLDGGGGYQMFLPGGRNAGGGRYAFDASGPRVRWLSGPMTDPRWDGAQKVEGDGAMLKIRIGARAVATSSGR